MVSSWLNLQKSNLDRRISRMTHHTSHIAYCTTTKRIIIVIHLNNSIKLPLNKFIEYFLIKIIVLTKKNVKVMSKITQIKNFIMKIDIFNKKNSLKVIELTYIKLSVFSKRSTRHNLFKIKKNYHFKYLSKFKNADLKKNVDENHDMETSRSAFFQNAQRSDFG